MLRFMIRDVLWLTVVVAMGVGWWADRQHAATKLSDLSAVIERMKLDHAKEMFVERIRHRNELFQQKQLAALNARGVALHGEPKP